jgi:putative transposase
MYEWRKMTREERSQVLAARKWLKRPWHAPPHFGQTRGVYMISAACYEHRPILATGARRTEWQMELIGGLGLDAICDIDIRAWAVLPNHYHLLIEADLGVFARLIAHLHNGTATRWNKVDKTPGRTVWHRFSDRSIRSERHYYASLNYIHANPVKHGHATSAADWAWSSLPLYLDMVGRERLAGWWRQYPVDEYGKGWDD